MTFKGQFWLKTVALSLLLMATGFILALRSRAEVIAERRQLSQLPLNIDTWSGRDLAIDQEVLKVLGPGDFMLRTYAGGAQSDIPVQAFIGYFASQRAGDTIHSPKNCLPGSGWVTKEAAYVSLRAPGGKTFLVNRFVVQKGDDKQLVLYWYQAHNRIVASEYAAKYYLVRDAIWMNRSDGALVRITTPLIPGEPFTDAEKRAVDFAEALVFQLKDHVPD
jgi:EpsI family protein